MVWNDTLREGPRNPTYFGLTTPDDSSASFGVNCDVPGLYFRWTKIDFMCNSQNLSVPWNIYEDFLIIINCLFSDTCVDDSDCKEIPHTVCRNVPVNEGLDPGTRGTEFKSWDPRDTILKSCFCKVKSLTLFYMGEQNPLTASKIENSILLIKVMTLIFM